MKRRLVNKLMLVTGAGVTITLALTVGLTGALTAERVRSEVKAHAADKAAGLATQVSVQLTESLAATTTMAATVSGLLATGSARRSDIVALTRATLEQYPSVYGAWMVDTLQRQSEKKLSGTEATNKAGIFTPYWTKSETGAVQPSTFEIKPASQWYAVPTSTGKSFVTEPYLTRGHVVTSVVTPIRLDSETVGVAGLDIKLEKLREFINAYRPFEDGRVMLLSSASKWIVPIDKDQAMKDYAEAGRDEVKAALADGRMRFLPGAADGMVRLIYPFTTPGMGTRWVLLIDVPGHVFSNPVTRAVVTTAAGGALLLLVMLTLIFVTTRSLIGRPLSRTLATIGALIDRDYTVAIPDTRRGDEIGSINTALEIFRDKAQQAETLLKEQEVNRVAQVQRATTISRHSEAFDHQVVALTEGVLALIGEVEAATARLRSEAQETSARSTSVAASSEQTAASVATIASATEELVASLGEIRRQMGLSTGVAENAVVQADQANTRVNALMSAVTRIGEVIKLINAIASQTNLLALNATIEAARAGEAGKGFAVVAAEVKELANQTSRATDEIAQQIESIQAETNEAAQSIRVISATIHELNGISQAIHSATDQQGQAMQEIAHNIQDVSHGTQDISASISVVSRSADHTSVVASEIGSTASTLSERSIRLRQEILQFISNVRQVA